MSLDQIAHDAAEAVKNLGSALLPAALGSAVAQAYQRGLDWRERLVQWVVGISVSYYVTLGLQQVTGFGPLAAQAVGFVLATLAFQATPKFIAGATDAAASLPGRIADWFLAFLPGRRGDDA